MSFEMKEADRTSTSSGSTYEGAEVSIQDVAGEAGANNYTPSSNEKGGDGGRLDCSCCHGRPTGVPEIDPKQVAKEAEEAWTLCSTKARKNDEDVARAWKEEIDALLVFAGLFSAVLTSFIVQVYPALVPNQQNSGDINTQILLRISSQLERSLSAGTDSTAASALNPMIDLANPNGIALDGPSAALTAINTLWFSSLILSLSASCIGLIVRQWLNHFISPTPADPVSSTYIHCLRWYMGFVAWHVSGTLSVLPILLQLAVILFLVGLVIMLWTLNFVVVGFTMPLVVALFCFITFTTLVPIWKPKCPYKSPQALFACWTVDWLHRFYRWLLECAAKAAAKVPRFADSRAAALLTHLLERAGESRKVYRTWISQEQSIVEEFVNDVVVPCLADQQDSNDMLTLRRFQRFTKEMQQPLTYAGRDAVGKITIDAASQIPDRVVCEFAMTTGEWLVHNVPLNRTSLVRLVTLANRVYHQDEAHKKAIGHLVTMILRRQPLVLSLIMDDWHADVDDGSPVDHEFVDFMINDALFRLGRATELLDEHPDRPPLPSQRQAINTAELACNLAMQLATLLPTPCLHAHLQGALREFEKGLRQWRARTADLQIGSMAQPAAKFFQHLHRRVRAHAALLAEENAPIRASALAQLGTAERRMTGSKARAEQVERILASCACR
ncbi:hypothetical protein OBBRIDRAFT_764103 [Obba rivulosa]|uniref:DUF6535 domain-containing protein n=1 Tax=Obba rivulosa TaxID=1052685 RepID=A0A8E2DG88_9APHY|nr:hypothetical protein OBBRIDRAFT_764103 [Obba rivulosa]